MQEKIQYEDFCRIKMLVGTIVQAQDNPGAHKPAFVLTIDFGEEGIRKSSAQITENYQAMDLLGKQVVAVVNFDGKNVAGVISEVLVLAALCPKSGTVLLQPSGPVKNGSRIG